MCQVWLKLYVIIRSRQQKPFDETFDGHIDWKRCIRLKHFLVLQRGIMHHKWLRGTESRADQKVNNQLFILIDTFVWISSSHWNFFIHNYRWSEFYFAYWGASRWKWQTMTSFLLSVLFPFNSERSNILFPPCSRFQSSTVVASFLSRQCAPSSLEIHCTG